MTVHSGHTTKLQHSSREVIHHRRTSVLVKSLLFWPTTKIFLLDFLEIYIKLSTINPRVVTFDLLTLNMALLLTAGTPLHAYHSKPFIVAHIFTLTSSRKTLISICASRHFWSLLITYSNLKPLNTLTFLYSPVRSSYMQTRARLNIFSSIWTKPKGQYRTHSLAEGWAPFPTPFL